MANFTKQFDTADAMKTIAIASLLLGGAAAAAAAAPTVAQINGKAYLSPYNGQTVSGVTGVVTAKSSSGIFIRGTTASSDRRSSNGLYLFGSALSKNASIGLDDVVTVSGKVSEYRSDPSYVYSTELASVTVSAVVKGNGSLPEPLVVGEDTPPPPRQQFSSLDGGDIFAVPNNKSLISVANPTLQPGRYGMDFWESLSGERVTVQAHVAIA